MSDVVDKSAMEYAGTILPVARLGQRVEPDELLALYCIPWDHFCANVQAACEDCGTLDNQLAYWE